MRRAAAVAAVRIKSFYAVVASITRQITKVFPTICRHTGLLLGAHNIIYKVFQHLRQILTIWCICSQSKSPKCRRLFLFGLSLLVKLCRSESVRCTYDNFQLVNNSHLLPFRNITVLKFVTCLNAKFRKRIIVEIEDRC